MHMRMLPRPVELLLDHASGDKLKAIKVALLYGRELPAFAQLDRHGHVIDLRSQWPQTHTEGRDVKRMTAAWSGFGRARIGS